MAARFVVLLFVCNNNLHSTLLFRRRSHRPSSFCNSSLNFLVLHGRKKVSILITWFILTMAVIQGLPHTLCEVASLCSITYWIQKQQSAQPTRWYHQQYSLLSVYLKRCKKRMSIIPMYPWICNSPLDKNHLMLDKRLKCDIGARNGL